MKNCLSMLVEVNVTSLDVYQEDFERDFLRQTREFYTRESQVFMASNTCPDYLRKVGTQRNLLPLAFLRTLSPSPSLFPSRDVVCGF